MGGHLVVGLCLVALAVMINVGASTTLTTDFYDESCPELFSIVKAEVEKAVEAEFRMAGSLVRLHFHDCFVNGCDASLLLDNTTTFTSEKYSKANNNSARGFEVIDTIKAAVEEACPQTVSCADILALTSRDCAVKMGLTKEYYVLFGRLDSLIANITAADAFLPAPSFNYDRLVQSFAAVGLDETDLVTLSGGHTIGRVKCSIVRAFLTDNDTNTEFRNILNASCPPQGDGNVVVPLDFNSPDQFDNQYYKDLEQGEGILRSDQTLYSSPGYSADLVEYYAQNQDDFYEQFALSTIKMGNINPLTGDQGEIRVNCRFPNSAGTLIAME